jgi:hypothetical protein
MASPLDKRLSDLEGLVFEDLEPELERERRAERREFMSRVFTAIGSIRRAGLVDGVPDSYPPETAYSIGTLPGLETAEVAPYVAALITLEHEEDRYKAQAILEGREDGQYFMHLVGLAVDLGAEVKARREGSSWGA